jgi:Protein kinase domain
MASVYLARLDSTVGFGKWVALKIIHPNIAADDRFVAMFLDEARLAAQLDHANLCSVFDFGEEDGTYYIAMEYLHGETLGAVARRAWASQGSLPLEFCVRVIADAARGLHAAHEMRDVDGSLAGVVHRDVSPENVFVTYTGTSKIVDFGVARSKLQEHDRTATGELKGKLAYMSPEQLHERDVDRRTDVWALGVVLWEVTVGRRLFRRQTDAQTVFAITRDPITRPSRLREDYPPALEAIVMRALDRDKERRYATALDLTRALEAWLNSTPQPVGVSEVGEFIQALFAEQITWRDRYLRVHDGPFEDLIAQWQAAPRTSVEAADANTVAMGLGIPGPDDGEDPTRMREAPTRAPLHEGGIFDPDGEPEPLEDPTRARVPRPSHIARTPLSDRVSPELRDPDADEPVGEAIPLTRRTIEPEPDEEPAVASYRLLMHTPQHTPPPVQREAPPPIAVPPRRSRWADYATIAALFVMGGVMAHIWYDRPVPRVVPRPVRVATPPRRVEAPRRVEPVVRRVEPVVRTPEPVVRTPEPVVRTPEPVVRTPEPVVRAPEPVVRAPEPVVRAPRLVVVDDGTRRSEGFLDVTTDTPAAVYLGDRLLGHTPIHDLAMSPGVYALRVVASGSAGEQQVLVTVRAGATARSEVNLLAGTPSP